MSGGEEEDIFKRKPRLVRSPHKSPPKRVWRSLPSQNSNSDKLSVAASSTVNNEENRRKSVSFSVPPISSTLFQGDNDFDSLIDFDLDPFVGAQASYSELNPEKTQILTVSTIHSRPFLVHSLVFLAEKFCIDSKINYDGALAESSNWKRSFLAELECANNQQSINLASVSVVETEHEDMSLSVNTIVQGVEKFNSQTQENVSAFIANIELYHDLCNGDVPLQTVVLKTVRSRLSAVTKLGNVQALSLEQIKARIKEKFKLTISFDAAQEKLLSIRQESKESIDAFGERTKTLLDQMNSVSANDNADVQNAQITANEALAIRKFKQNLYNENIRMMSLSIAHTDLYQAIAFATEKFEEMRLSNVRQEQPKAQANNNNQKKASGDDKQSGSKMFCHLCKKKNHFTRDCFLKKKNQQSSGNSNKSNENDDKPFAEKKFNRAGKQRSMNQASSCNADECDESDAHSNAGECAQQMQLHTFGAHLNC